MPTQGFERHDHAQCIAANLQTVDAANRACS